MMFLGPMAGLVLQHKGNASQTKCDSYQSGQRGGGPTMEEQRALHPGGAASEMEERRTSRAGQQCGKLGCEAMLALSTVICTRQQCSVEN